MVTLVTGCPSGTRMNGAGGKRGLFRDNDGALSVRYAMVYREFWKMCTRNRHGLTISKAVGAKTLAATIVFVLTLVIMPFYTEGDQVNYRKAYEELANLYLVEGFLYYSSWIGSKEIFHFVLSWVASRFVEKDLLIGVSNGILAYVAMSLFLKWKASLIISFFLVSLNFYFFSLYFAAERLKFGFMFLAISLFCIDRPMPFYWFGVLALISHVQTLLVYGCLFFKVAVRQTARFLRSGMVSKSLLLLPFAVIPVLFMKEHILGKLQAYSLQIGLSEIAKTALFLVLSMWYSKRRSEPVILFIPILFAVLLVGGFRINVFGYFVFLYYGLQSKGGWNLGVLSTSTYFAYCAIDFVANIFKYGHGYP